MSDSQPRFQDVSARVDFPALDARILAFWKANDIFHKSLEGREDAPVFVFYEGPPTANGRPGSHHVISRIFKDLFPRYKTMRGYRVPRKAGWDTHGLPVELEVERRLGIDGKGQIEAYGVAEFNELCKESVTTYLAEWERFTERIGFWVDLDDAYYTYTNDYIESVWSLLRQIWDKDLLYEGHKVVPYCPRCGTAISSHEVAQGYKDVTEDSIYVRFPLTAEAAAKVSEGVDGAGAAGGAGRRATASPRPSRSPSGPPRRGRSSATSRPRCTRTWSTRSWRVAASASSWPATSSPRCSASRPRCCASSPAPSCSGSSTSRCSTTCSRTSAPTSSSAATTSPPPTAPASCTSRRRSARTTCASAWRTTCRWSTPSTSRASSSPRSRRGPASSSRTPTRPSRTSSRSAACCSASSPTSTATRSAGAATRRCSTTPRPTWYIRTTAIKDQLIAANDDVVWHPEHIKTGRFGEWLAGNIDWALSRDRYWGTPLPIWRCEQGHTHCVGSVAELRELAAGPVPEDLELHRPYVDDVIAHLPRVRRRDAPRARGHRRLVRLRLHAVRPVALPVRERGDVRRALPGRLHRRGHRPDPRLVLQPARHRHAHRGPQLVQARALPGAHPRRRGPEDEQEQGQRGAAGRHPRPPGRRRVPLVHVQQPAAVEPAPVQRRDGRRGRAQVPAHAVEHVQLLHAVRQHRPVRPGGDGVAARGPAAASTAGSSASSTTLVQDVTAGLEAYDATGTARRIQEFVDDLSNWYVRRSRRRFWKSESDADKLAAYHTLYEALVTVAKLLAPFTPFVAEELYQNLVRSVDGAGRGRRRSRACAGERAPVRVAGRRRAGRRRRRQLRHGGRAARGRDGPRRAQRRRGQDAAAAGRGRRGAARGRGAGGRASPRRGARRAQRQGPALRGRRGRARRLHRQAQPQGARAQARQTAWAAAGGAQAGGRGGARGRRAHGRRRRRRLCRTARSASPRTSSSSRPARRRATRSSPRADASSRSRPWSTMPCARRAWRASSSTPFSSRAKLPTFVSKTPSA